MKTVPIVENVLKLNDEVASINRELLRERDVLTIDLIGGPGCGKTTLLEETLRRLKGDHEIGVLAGDLTTTRDADRLHQWCDQVVQINTGKGCHLDANQVRQGMAQLDLGALDVLFIENVGNLICPVGFDLGQDVKVGMFSVSEGDDKAVKHPYLVYESAVVLLNKTDLLPHVAFDNAAFCADVKRLNPSVDILEISASTGQIDPWIQWLAGLIAAPQSSHVVHAEQEGAGS